MAVTLSNAENALKTVYLDAVREQLNTKANPFLSMVNRTSRNIWGKEIRQPVVHGINGGFSSGTEDGALPISSGCKYENFALTLKNFYGVIEISDKAIRASENNSGAFVNLLNAEMESLIQACSLNFGRMLFGDGSGKLATVERVYKDGKIKMNNVKNLMEGMIVDFICSDEEHVISEQKRISSVDESNNTITVDNLKVHPDILKDSFITIQGSYNKELTGLEAVFSKTGELYGLDKSTHKWLIPYIKEKQGRITEEALQNAIDSVEEKSGGKINIILCSYDVKRELRKIFPTYDGGSLSYNGIPIVADRFCPDGTLYLLNTNDFTLHQLCDWVWLGNSSGSILQQVPNKPIYKATLVKYADLICSKPCGQGKITGIKEEY